MCSKSAIATLPRLAKLAVRDNNNLKLATMKTLKTFTPLLLPALFCTAAIALTVWMVVFAAFSLTGNI